MAHPNLFTRDDTFFGVCQGLGDDLGISPDLLRVAFAVALFWNPVAVLCAYLALGAVVFLSRRTFPERRAADAQVAAAPAPVAVREEREREELPLAA